MNTANARRDAKDRGRRPETSEVCVGRSATHSGCWELSCWVWVPRPLDEVFAFFADATNLERLTPGFLRFEVVTPAPIPMHEGALIDYKLRVRGIPLKWRTRITRWDPPHAFEDTQLKGPYSVWQHTHRFEAVDGGTRVTDVVRYRPPLGALTHWAIRGDVERIFEFRQRELAELFAE